MKMKKFLTMAAIAAICVPMLTACTDYENDNPTPPHVETPTVEGIFLINSGNSGDQIPGSLTYIGNDGSTTANAFATVNGRVLGNTPNDVLVYGSKLYIVVTGENTVEVVDKTTFKSIKQISTTELMGTDKGKQPRRMAAGGAYVYLSTFDGYVAAIDTTEYTAAKIYQVGSYPEGMACDNGNLYVANSDYGQGINPSISKINLETDEVTDFKNELIKNPTSLVCTNGNLYILDYGSYDASWNQIGAGVYCLKSGIVSKVADATMMAVDTNHNLIYTINAPYTVSGTTTTFNVYDINSGTTKTFITGEDIISPAAITVDPVKGDVYIASYKKNVDTGYPDYSANGYVNQYTAEGVFARQYEAGVGPTAFALNFSYVTLY